MYTSLHPVMEKQHKNINMYICVYALKNEIGRIGTNRFAGVFFGGRVMGYYFFLYFQKS